MNGSTESTGTRFDFLDLKNYPVSVKTVSLRELGNNVIPGPGERKSYRTGSRQNVQVSLIGKDCGIW
jgi:hypothetical protein